MKFQNFNFMKYVLLSEIILTIGCSANTSDPITGSPTFPLTVTSVPSASLFTEGKIAFVSVNGFDDGIYVINADGSGLKKLTATLPYSRNPAWSPDGNHIAFNSPMNGIEQIYSMQADGSELRQLTFDKSHSYNPVWSFDGKYIIFLSQREDTLDISSVPVQQGYVMKSDGSEQHRFTSDQEFVDAVSRYPKEDYLSISIAETRYAVKTYITDLNGVIQEQFPEFVIDGIPIWSPNGEFVVFNTIRTDCSGIIVANANGSNQKCLMIHDLSPSVHIGGVSWSPDGKHIIFSSNLDGDSDLYVVKTDGSNLIQLTDMSGDEGTPAWFAEQ